MLATHTNTAIESAVTWKFDYDIFFCIEVPTDTIRHLLPRLVHPYEVRPNVSVLGCGLHHFEAGNLNGRLPKMGEVNCSILVHPNLSLNTPMPRFSLFVLYIASPCDDFIHYATTVDKMPTYNTQNLRWTVSTDGHQVEIMDDFGPMFSFKNTHPKPVYKKDEFTGQTFTYANGKNLYCTPFKWEGYLFQHQHTGKDFGKIYKHPSLKNLGIEIDEDNQNCYLQMIPEMGANSKGSLTYWDPIKIY